MQGFPGGNGPPDLVKLQSNMQAIEQACASIQMHINPASAEATILSLSQSPQPYEACKFILENSQVANARFQAAAAIRDASVREWALFTSDEKKTLISFCLTYVMQHANSPEGYVVLKVSSVAAQLLKRAWLEFINDEKNAFFGRVNQAISGNHGVHVQFAGIKFLESLVSEFSPSTSSVMGLPREFHEQCRKSLELTYLKNFYCSAQDAALNVSNQIIESQSAIPEVEVCNAALQLMFQILNWDFVCNSSIELSNTTWRPDHNLVQPGPAWHEILITRGHTSWLLSLYSALRQKFASEGYWMDCPIAVSARKLILQLCSMVGTIFPSG